MSTDWPLNYWTDHKIQDLRCIGYARNNRTEVVWNQPQALLIGEIRTEVVWNQPQALLIGEIRTEVV